MEAGSVWLKQVYKQGGWELGTLRTPHENENADDVETNHYSVIHCKYINLSDCHGLFKYIPTLNWMGVISAPSCKKNVDDFLMNKVIDNMLYVALELIFISGKLTFNNKYLI